jgi:imidazolonepropionase-like amidohydrolase
MQPTCNVVVLIALAAACVSGVAVSGLRAQSPAPATVTVLRFGSVWDGAKVTRNAFVVVEGDRVKSVGTGAGDVPANAAVVDLSRYYGIPGMIDAHTHITYWADAALRPGVRPTQTSMALPTAVRVFMAQENARKSLEAGFTTVRAWAPRSTRIWRCAIS